jgi:hypothetical protein
MLNSQNKLNGKLVYVDKKHVYFHIKIITIEMNMDEQYRIIISNK